MDKRNQKKVKSDSKLATASAIICTDNTTGKKKILNIL